MIKAERINFSYEKEKELIQDLSIEIEEGKITTIIGPNGSGKSTLLSLLCGLNKVTSGEIYIDNVSITKFSYKQLSQKISTVHQQNSVPSDITVEKLVSYGRIPHKKLFKGKAEEDNEIIDWAIKNTGLEKLKTSNVMGLSGGERQRAFIAMALSQKPKILFLDEPTTYLDMYHQIEILELIKKLNHENNLTVVMILHDINQAIKYSHNMVVMKSGNIIKSGESAKIITEELIRAVYKVDGKINEYNKELRYFIPSKCINFE